MHGTLDTLQFLMTREITRMKSFTGALDGLGKAPLETGMLPPSAGLVDQFFNDSSREGQDGAVDLSSEWATQQRFTVGGTAAARLSSAAVAIRGVPSDRRHQ